jgi:hypothetical protein
MKISPITLIKGVFNNTYRQNDEKNSFAGDAHLNRFAAFIEIPNWRKVALLLTDDSNKTQPLLMPQTWGNLGKKFVGWQDNVRTIKKVRNIFLAVFFFVPINLATVLIRTPINIVRLFTEFLPALVWTAAAFKLRAILMAEEKTPGAIALGIFLGIIYAAGYLIALASRSITNPVNALMGAWMHGSKHALIKNKYLRVFIGASLAITSLAFTIIGFTLLAGIPAIQAGVAALLHYVASVLPQVMAALSGIGMFAAKAVSTLLWFAPAVGQFLAAGVAAMPELLGIAGLAALLMPTLGNLLSPMIVRFQKNWHAPQMKQSNDLSKFMMMGVDSETEPALRSLPAYLPSSYTKVHRGGVNLTSFRPIDELPVAKPVASSLAPVDVGSNDEPEVSLSEAEANATTPRRRSLSASSSE